MRSYEAALLELIATAKLSHDMGTAMSTTIVSGFTIVGSTIETPRCASVLNIASLGHCSLCVKEQVSDSQPGVLATLLARSPSMKVGPPGKLASVAK